jgi:16S rRNA (guanine966-N2)-methyltransferase
VRVISGRLGGRTLVAPRGSATRPTSDRVREALFSILGDLAGADVLDLYAGTGAFGIEALSRGAASATFVEQARAALRALGQNIERLEIGPFTKILAMTVERAVAEMPWGANAFDVVFVDPPYAEVRAARGPLARDVWQVIGPSVRAGGTMVLEHAKKVPPPDVSGLELGSTRMYGDTALSFYLR